MLSIAIVWPAAEANPPASAPAPPRISQLAVALLITISLIMCTLLHFNSSRHGSLQMELELEMAAPAGSCVLERRETPFLIGSNNRNQVNVSVQFTR